MKAVTVGGLAFLASAALCLAAATGAALDGVARGVGAWLAVVAAAVLYRRIATGPAGERLPEPPGVPSARGPASVALALLGVVASTWTVRAALLTAFPPAAGAPAPGSGAIGLLAALGSGIGLALLAWVAGRAGLVPRPAAVLSGVAALAAVAAPDPGWPYVGGGAVLGTALLLAGARSRPHRVQTPQPGSRPTGGSGRAERIRTRTTVHTAAPPRPI